MLYQSLPDQDEKTMTCRSRGKESEISGSLDHEFTENYIYKTIFCFAAPLHPIPSPWKFQHPFHGRLTSNMSCKCCEQQVSLIKLRKWKTSEFVLGFFKNVFQGNSCVHFAFFPESSTLWLLWESFPVHPFTSVGKHNQYHYSKIKWCTVITVYQLNIHFVVLFNLMGICPQGRPLSLDQCLQHFISSETIKEVECENCTKVCHHHSFFLNLVLTENQGQTN